MAPCPFCNGSFESTTNHILDTGTDGWQGHAIVCSQCGARGPVCVTRHEARLAWRGDVGLTRRPRSVTPEQWMTLGEIQERLKQSRKTREDIEARHGLGIRAPGWKKEGEIG